MTDHKDQLQRAWALAKHHQLFELSDRIHDVEQYIVEIERAFAEAKEKLARQQEELEENDQSSMDAFGAVIASWCAMEVRGQRDDLAEELKETQKQLDLLESCVKVYANPQLWSAHTPPMHDTWLRGTIGCCEAQEALRELKARRDEWQKRNDDKLSAVYGPTDRVQ